jgi:hypothetical protein
MGQEELKIEKGQEVKKIDQEQEKAKSPISEGEMFFPELELKDINSLSSKERKEALEKWKEKYVYQKEGFAKMQEDFVSKIRENPDISLEDLNKNLEEWGTRYGFTPQQKKIAETILQEYEQKHQAVSKYRKEYPEDEKLFEAVFGVKPKGKVEILEGPITLCVKCYCLEDYALIRDQAFIYRRNLTIEEVNSASRSKGVSIGTSLIKELAGTIIAQNATGRDFDKDADRVFVHEEQHAIKRLFKEIPIRENFLEEIISSARLNDNEKIKLSIAKFLRLDREIPEIKVKDEILAYMKARYEVVGVGKKEAVINAIYKILTNTEKNYTYYYFEEDREKLRETFLGKSNLGGVIYNALNLKDKENLKQQIIKDYKEADKQVFEDEYKQMVWEGLNVYKALRDSGYSQEQVIALLINEPLIKWPKVVARILGKFDVVKRKD